MGKQEMTFKDCCQAVVDAFQERKGGRYMPYATEYARAGLSMEDQDAIRVQSLYILNNLNGWHGEKAKKVKARLRELGFIPH